MRSLVSRLLLALAALVLAAGGVMHTRAFDKRLAAFDGFPPAHLLACAAASATLGGLALLRIDQAGR